MTETRYLVASLILAAVVLMNLPLPASMRVQASARDAAAPFQNVMHLALCSIHDWWTVVLHARRVLRDRQAVEERLLALDHAEQSARDLEIENNRLRKQLDFTRNSRRKLIPCEVVLRTDTAGWWRCVRLNKGSAHGVRPNMAVIAIEGLVGKTINVSEFSCDALLITDPGCEMACRFRAGGAFGIVRGTGVAANGGHGLSLLSAVNPCEMDYVDKNHAVREDDEIVTSGLGGVFPEGIVVGRARKSVLDASGLFQRIDVAPAADLADLRYVFVVRK